MSLNEDTTTSETIAKVTIEVPEEQIKSFVSFLDSFISQHHDSTLEAPFCCYLTIRDSFGERNQQVGMNANNIDEARIKCLQIAYDYYRTHPGKAVSGRADTGACRHLP
jgi:hypothetical protein